jgi:hypothetical protein
LLTPGRKCDSAIPGRAGLSGLAGRLFTVPSGPGAGRAEPGGPACHRDDNVNRRGRGYTIGPERSGITKGHKEGDEIETMEFVAGRCVVPFELSMATDLACDRSLDMNTRI